ncbi:MAG: hypothetical protein QG606_125 [Patescibacteria group bacterium]|nr:hypothetical protein [Patescibacteria group bacterium]
MQTKQKVVILLVALAIVGLGGYFFNTSGEKRQAIRLDNDTKSMNSPEESTANQGDVSPISGVACEHWNRRPVAVMQPADPSARPAAGFSSADMVFEMPVFTNSNTRLMGVYLCDIPDDIGSMRSARHDYLPLAKGLDAVFIHWGYSKFAETLLERKVVENINCLTTSFCPRWAQTGKMKYEDTGRITRENILQAMEKYQYRTTNNFVGYPHQNELSLESRPTGGRIRLAYPNPYDVSYDYDKATNTYLRTWDDGADMDKNNNARVAPKNIVVAIVESEQVKLATDYKARGVQDPWELVPEHDRAGLDYGGVGRYNNLEMGDPWFDTKDTGDAFFYMNGQEMKGVWKKDKSKLESKLTFYQADGSEVKFVPGQIWVNVVEPSYGIKWEPGS